MDRWIDEERIRKKTPDGHPTALQAVGPAQGQPHHNVPHWFLTSPLKATRQGG